MGIKADVEIRKGDTVEWDGADGKVTRGEVHRGGKLVRAVTPDGKHAMLAPAEAFRKVGDRLPRRKPVVGPGASRCDFDGVA